MTVLGEAIIEVRADLSPFIRGLDRQLRAATEAFEQRLQRAVERGLGDFPGSTQGEQLGENLGEGIDRGLGRRFNGNNSDFITGLFASIGSALDDGLSALPTEVKAAIVVGLASASPLLAGGIAGAVSAGIGAGVAGVGTLLAFQYEDVLNRGVVMAERLRMQLITAASSFVPAVINGIAMIEQRFFDLGPLINRIFTKASTFVEPLTNGILNFISEVLDGIDDALGDSGGFVDELMRGLRTLGFALGEVMRILAATGEDGKVAFRDLIFLVSDLLVGIARIVAGLTEFYGLLRSIAGESSLLVLLSDAAAQSNVAYAWTNTQLAGSMDGVVKMTEEEEKRLKDLKKALDDASDATYGIIESQIDFERSLDEIRASLEENGATLDITNEKGRRNAEEFITGLKAVEEETVNQVAIGKMSAQQAAEHYDLQIAKLREVATQGGLTALQFDMMYGDIIRVAQLKLDAQAMGIIGTGEELAAATHQAADLWQELQRIKNFRLPSVGTRRFSEYAEGGIVTHPTFGLIGEAGPEVVIPLTKPQRAAQLMRQSGLADSLGTAGTTVNVYVGNEQLDAHTYRVVESNNTALSNSLAYGARGL